jgi:hypothetical protein
VEDLTKKNVFSLLVITFLLLLFHPLSLLSSCVVLLLASSPLLTDLCSVCALPCLLATLATTGYRASREPREPSVVQSAGLQANNTRVLACLLAAHCSPLSSIEAGSLAVSRLALPCRVSSWSSWCRMRQLRVESFLCSLAVIVGGVGSSLCG